jgi:hypothetical protein
VSYEGLRVGPSPNSNSPERNRLDGDFKEKAKKIIHINPK